MSERGTWDITWERCPDCPRPVMDGVPHVHPDPTGELIDFEGLDEL